MCVGEESYLFKWVWCVDSNSIRFKLTWFNVEVNPWRCEFNYKKVVVVLMITCYVQQVSEITLDESDWNRSIICVVQQHYVQTISRWINFSISTDGGRRRIRCWVRFSSTVVYEKYVVWFGSKQSDHIIR